MTLLEEARELIRKHLAASDQTIAGMARAADIPIPTARSIIQGEVSQTSKENITALLLTFMSFAEVLTLVNKHSKTDKFWAGVMKICESRNGKNIPAQGFEYKHPDHKILGLASSSLGIRRERVYQLYGSEGEKRLEALLDAGILREVSGVIKQQADYVQYPVSDSKRKAELHAQSWEEGDMQLGDFLYHITQNLNDEGHEIARELLRDLILKLTDLEKTHPGGDKVLLFTLIGNKLQG